MSPHCVWLVLVGGYDELEWKDVGGGVKEPIDELITDTNRLIMIIELGNIIIFIKITLLYNEDYQLLFNLLKILFVLISVYIEAGEWIVQSVLDANDLTSKNYQEKYSSYNKTRTWWMDQLIEYPTEKEMKLQRYIQSLHQELQVAHQNKVSLQEALTEANKQGTCTCTCVT